MNFGHIAEGWRNFQSISNELDPLEQTGAKVATTAVGMPELGRAYNAMPAWARTAGLIGQIGFDTALVTPGAAIAGLALLGSTGVGANLGRAPRSRGATPRTQDIARSQESAELGYGGLWP